MAEAEEQNLEATRPELPTVRVKKIMKLDKDINKVPSEALFVVTHSTELFLQFIAEKSAEVAVEKKKKTIKLDHLRVTVKRHRPISDFLLDSLPVPTESLDLPATEKRRSSPILEKPLPVGTRRIDDFFHKPASEATVQIDD